MELLETKEAVIKHGQDISDIYYSNYRLSVFKVGKVYMANIQRYGTEGDWVTSDGKPFNGRNSDFETAEKAKEAMEFQFAQMQERSN